MLLIRNLVKHRAVLPFAASFSGKFGCESDGKCHLCGRPVKKTMYSAPNVLEHAPDFKGKVFYKNDFKEISLSDYKGKYVVLFFYPADFSFVCPTEIREFSQSAKKFRQLSNSSTNIDCEVIGCSVDSAFVHREFTEKPASEGGLGPVDIPLLADGSKDISTSYGLVVKEGENKGVALR
eukprot:TRINITY_DN8724_c0_g1_i8.p1 TRINITY_DN8724_c0_g1~~TRINITY_DN8724_c0_g1_i8.p1  ORF type:complete len:179 (-),score=49.68 TRINITY_DN8724_c0_g1_i8:343-879(-)